MAVFKYGQQRPVNPPQVSSALFAQSMVQAEESVVGPRSPVQKHCNKRIRWREETVAVEICEPWRVDGTSSLCVVVKVIGTTW